MTGAELKRLRTKLGVTQAQLAQWVGVDANSIARYERGEVRIGEPLARLVRILVVGMTGSAT